PCLNFEKFVSNQQLASRLDQFRRDIVEVDSFECLIDMQLARFTSCLIDAVPIEHAISGVAVLLDLDQQISRAYSVEPSSRQKHCIASSHFDRVDFIGS